MRPQDVQGEPCACEACVLAGVSGRPVRRDPRTGRWMHGRELRKWWDAHDAFWARVKQAPKGMR